MHKYLPTGHAVHASEVVDAARLYVPEAHAVQPLVPVVSAL